MVKQIIMSFISAVTGAGTLRAAYVNMLEPQIIGSVEGFFTVTGVIFGSLLSMILCIYWAIKLIQLINKLINKKNDNAKS